MATEIKMTPAKAWMAAIGTVSTAVASAAATVQVVLDDGALDAGEYGIIATALAVLISSIYGVWKTPNKVIEPPADAADPGTVRYQRGQFPS